MTTPREDGEAVEAEATIVSEEEDGQGEELDIGPLDRAIDEVGPDLLIQQKQEGTRSILAISLTALFSLLVLLPLLFWSVKGFDINDWLQSALPAVTGLLGSAMGFYFGTRATPS